MIIINISSCSGGIQMDFFCVKQPYDKYIQHSSGTSLLTVVACNGGLVCDVFFLNKSVSK